jgi:hypothetical protein
MIFVYGVSYCSSIHIGFSWLTNPVNIIITPLTDLVNGNFATNINKFTPVPTDQQQQ